MLRRIALKDPKVRFFRARLIDAFQLNPHFVDTFVKQVNQEFPDTLKVPGDPAELWLETKDVKAFDQWCEENKMKAVKLRGLPGFSFNGVRFVMDNKHTHVVIRFL